MSLTTAAVRNVSAVGKTTKLYDGRGLYLEVSPSGGKLWRFKYRFEGKEKRLSLGVFPDVSLKDARDHLDQARKLLADGVDLSVHKKAKKFEKANLNTNTLELVTREWFGKHEATRAPNHHVRVVRLVERDIFPVLGCRPISDVSGSALLTVLRRIEARGALDTAHRALSYCGQVFRYGIATGRCDRDPSINLRGALPTVKGTHFAATTDPKDFAEIVRAIDGYEGMLTVRCALRLAPLLFARPGELRRAEWKDIDFDAAEWRYTASKTKIPHIVPLSRQSVNILRELYALTGTGQYVFPGARSNERPMSDNAILAAMRRMGIEKTELSGHGFRAVARTILNEVLNVRPDYIEHQLAHAVRDPNGKAYNRTAHLQERKLMMQQWADYLDKLKVSADVISSNKIV